MEVGRSWVRSLVSVFKGYKYFIESYIFDVEVEENDDELGQGIIHGDVTVRGKCFHSQLKTEKPHTMHISLKRDNEENLYVEECHCIGLSQSCHHLIGLGFFLQDSILRGLTVIPENKTCTSKPMDWHKPRGMKISPENIMNVVFPKSTNLRRKRKPVHYKQFQPKKFILGEDPDANVSSATQIKRMKTALQDIDHRIPFAYLITEDNDESMSTYALQQSVIEQIAEDNDCLRPNLPYINSSSIDILLSQHIPNAVHCLNFTTSMSSEIEENTRAQNTCEQWFHYRQNRFTASNFKTICRRRKAFDAIFLRSLWEKKNLQHVKTIQHGKREEPVAKKYYEKKYGNTVFSCGLIIHPCAPHLGASPDGIIYDPNVGYGVLEVKCPCGKNNSTLEEALKNKAFILMKDENNELDVRPDHEYYYQIQGQMLLSGLDWCDLAIYFKSENLLVVKRVNLDKSFCLDMYTKLTDIYNKNVLSLL